MKRSSRAQKRLENWRREHMAPADFDALEDFLAAASEIPLAEAALDWARANNIEFIVDKETAAGGYYWPGTGVVGLSSRKLDPEKFVDGIDALVHEIRHAWQDAQGFFYTQDRAGVTLAQSIIIEGLLEADAFAHGRLAGAQADLADTEGRLDMLRDLQKADPSQQRQPLIDIYYKARRDLRADVGHAPETLRRLFLEWYDDFSFALPYGEARRNLFARRLGLPVPRSTAVRAQFNSRAKPLGGKSDPRPDLWRREGRQRLGRSFAGVNYLAQMDEDLFQKRLLSPQEALRFFQTPEQENQTGPSSITTRVRKAELKRNLQIAIRRKP